MNTTSTNSKCRKVHLPDDIRPSWLNVVRRLQSVARNQQGFAIIQIAVFVNQDGHPIQWTEPKLTRLEPKTPNDQFIEFLDKFPYGS